jgi:HEAT repeat protein
VNERLATIAASGTQSLQLANEWAGELVADDVPVLEQVLVDSEPVERELLMQHVLPRLSPAYAALVQLQSSDVAVRRAGAQQLGRLGHESSLSESTTREVTRLMRLEQDGLVWRLVMQGVHPDGSEAAGQIALLALNSQWPDVRVLGCQYIGHHGQIEQAPWLLPLLNDSSRVVQTAAVVAAGKCRNPMLLEGLRESEGQPALPGLRRLLTESDGQVHYLVVVSMSQLGDPQAMDELVRLAMDPGSKMRLEIVHTLGTSGQTRFIGPLIRLAWTESQPHVRQAALESLLKLVPEGEHPQRLKQARNPVEAVEIWTAWWEDRQHQRPEESVSDRRQPPLPATNAGGGISPVPPQRL